VHQFGVIKQCLNTVDARYKQKKTIISIHLLLLLLPLLLLLLLLSLFLLQLLLLLQLLNLVLT